MKIAIAILLFILLFSSAQTQYYLRGEIRDEKDNPLPNARIILHSTGYLYFSGTSGAFGIQTSRQIDSVTISLDGYQTTSIRLASSKYEQIKLKNMNASASIQRNKLVSFTKNLKLEDRENWTVGGETYSSILENEFIPSRKYPETGFAIHTNKASYSNLRRFLNMGTEVPPDAVRTEELLNYFNFGYTAPPADSVFGFNSQVSDCPWNPENQLLFLQINARKIDPEKIPPANLVFLIDISGSMDMPNRLPLLKSSFKLLVDNLREKDTVTIVVYGSTVGVWMTPTSGKEKEKIRKSIEDLYPGGPTPGESGIRTAFRVAKSQFIKNGNNRVILATDGDFNVGQSTEEELDKLITQHQQFGIYLTCLGVGMGNYKDSKLEVLAKKGNGNFAYLDNEREGEKVLVKELTQTLYTVADDAFVSIQFNPELVREYRLIGFDNKLRVLTDSLSELEGGELGSGHSLIALFEITPQPEHTNTFYEKDGLAKVKIQFKKPKDSLLSVTTYKCPFELSTFDELPSCSRFAASVALFGSLVKNSKYTRRVNFTDAWLLANQSYNANDAVQKEFLTLIDKAKKIYSRGKKRRKD